MGGRDQQSEREQKEFRVVDNGKGVDSAGKIIANRSTDFTVSKTEETVTDSERPPSDSLPESSETEAPLMSDTNNFNQPQPGPDTSARVKSLTPFSRRACHQDAVQLQDARRSSSGSDKLSGSTDEVFLYAGRSRRSPMISRRRDESRFASSEVLNSGTESSDAKKAVGQQPVVWEKRVPDESSENSRIGSITEEGPYRYDSNYSRGSLSQDFYTAETGTVSDLDSCASPPLPTATVKTASSTSNVENADSAPDIFQVSTVETTATSAGSSPLYQQVLDSKYDSMSDKLPTSTPQDTAAKAGVNMSRSPQMRTSTESLNQPAKSRPRSTIFSDMRERVFGSQKPSIADEFNRLSREKMRSTDLKKAVQGNIDDSSQSHDENQDTCKKVGYEEKHDDQNVWQLQEKQKQCTISKTPTTAANFVKVEDRKEVTLLKNETSRSQSNELSKSEKPATRNEQNRQERVSEVARVSEVVSEENIPENKTETLDITNVSEKSIQGNLQTSLINSKSNSSLSHPAVSSSVSRVGWAKKKFGSSHTPEAKTGTISKPVIPLDSLVSTSPSDVGTCFQPGISNSTSIGSSSKGNKMETATVVENTTATTIRDTTDKSNESNIASQNMSAVKVTPTGARKSYQTVKTSPTNGSGSAKITSSSGMMPLTSQLLARIISATSGILPIPSRSSAKTVASTSSTITPTPTPPKITSTATGVTLQKSEGVSSMTAGVVTAKSDSPSKKVDTTSGSVLAAPQTPAKMTPSSVVTVAATAQTPIMVATISSVTVPVATSARMTVAGTGAQTSHTPATSTFQATGRVQQVAQTPARIATETTGFVQQTSPTPARLANQTTPIEQQTAKSPVMIVSPATSIIIVQQPQAPARAVTQTTSTVQQTSQTPVKITTQTTQMIQQTPQTPAKVTTQTTPILQQTSQTPVRIATQTTPMVQQTPQTPARVATQTTPIVQQSSQTPARVATRTTPIVQQTSQTLPRVATQTTSVVQQISKTPTRVATQTGPIVQQTTRAPARVTTQTTPIIQQTSQTPVRVATQTTPVVQQISPTPVRVATQTTPVVQQTPQTPAKVATQTTPVVQQTSQTPVRVATQTTPIVQQTSHTPVMVATQTTPVVQQTSQTPARVSTQPTPNVQLTSQTPANVIAIMQQSPARMVAFTTGIVSTTPAGVASQLSGTALQQRTQAPAEIVPLVPDNVLIPTPLPRLKKNVSANGTRPISTGIISTARVTGTLPLTTEPFLQTTASAVALPTTFSPLPAITTSSAVGPVLLTSQTPAVMTPATGTIVLTSKTPYLVNSSDKRTVPFTSQTEAGMISSTAGSVLSTHQTSATGIDPLTFQTRAIMTSPTAVNVPFTSQTRTTMSSLTAVNVPITSQTRTMMTSSTSVNVPFTSETRVTMTSSTAVNVPFTSQTRAIMTSPTGLNVPVTSQTRTTMSSSTGENVPITSQIRAIMTSSTSVNVPFTSETRAIMTSPTALNVPFTSETQTTMSSSTSVNAPFTSQTRTAMTSSTSVNVPFTSQAQPNMSASVAGTVLSTSIAPAVVAPKYKEAVLSTPKSPSMISSSAVETFPVKPQRSETAIPYTPSPSQSFLETSVATSISLSNRLRPETPPSKSLVVVAVVSDPEIPEITLAVQQLKPMVVVEQTIPENQIVTIVPVPLPENEIREPETDRSETADNKTPRKLETVEGNDMTFKRDSIPLNCEHLRQKRLDDGRPLSSQTSVRGSSQIPKTAVQPDEVDALEPFNSKVELKLSNLRSQNLDLVSRQSALSGLAGKTSEASKIFEKADLKEATASSSWENPPSTKSSASIVLSPTLSDHRRARNFDIIEKQNENMKENLTDYDVKTGERSTNDSFVLDNRRQQDTVLDTRRQQDTMSDIRRQQDTISEIRRQPDTLRDNRRQQDMVSDTLRKQDTVSDVRRQLDTSEGTQLHRTCTSQAGQKEMQSINQENSRSDQSDLRTNPQAVTLSRQSDVTPAPLEAVTQIKQDDISSRIGEFVNRQLSSNVLNRSEVNAPSRPVVPSSGTLGTPHLNTSKSMGHLAYIAATQHGDAISKSAAYLALEQRVLNKHPESVSPTRSPEPPSSDKSPGKDHDGSHSKHHGANLGFKVEHVVSALAKKESGVSKSSPKVLPLLGKSLDSSCIVRKQLIHLESALHPSSTASGGLTSTEATKSDVKRSPRLVRKPKPLLSKAKTVDISDMDVDPELAVFLKSRKEMSSDSDDEDTKHKKTDTKPPLVRTVEGNESLGPEDRTVPIADRIKHMETIVGKTFFSALRAKAISSRAAPSPTTVDQSEEQKNADRLASFALISDVSVGARRREFQKRHLATSPRNIEPDEDSDKLPAFQSEPKHLPCFSVSDEPRQREQEPGISQGSSREQDTVFSLAKHTPQSKTRQFQEINVPRIELQSPASDSTPEQAWLLPPFQSGGGTTSQQILSPRMVDTVASGQSQNPASSTYTTPTRVTSMTSPELDSDDEFDQLVEINIKQLVDEPPTPVETPIHVRMAPILEIPKTVTGSQTCPGSSRTPEPEMDMNSGKFVSPNIASRVSEWEAAVAEEQAAKKLASLRCSTGSGSVEIAGGLNPSRWMDQGTASPLPVRKQPEKSSSSSDQQTTNEESEDELSKLSLAEKMKLFTVSKPEEHRRLDRGKTRRHMARYQTQPTGGPPITWDELEQVHVSSSPSEQAHVPSTSSDNNTKRQTDYFEREPAVTSQSYRQHNPVSKDPYMHGNTVYYMDY